MELGLRQGIDYTFSDTATDQWALQTVPFIRGYLNASEKVKPYLGLGLGVQYNGDYINGLVSPEAGIRLFIDDHSFVGASYNYETQFNRFENFFDMGNGQHVGLINIGYNFGERPAPVCHCTDDGCKDQLEECRGNLDRFKVKLKK